MRLSVTFPEFENVVWKAKHYADGSVDNYTAHIGGCRLVVDEYLVNDSDAEGPAYWMCDLEVNEVSVRVDDDRKEYIDLEQCKRAVYAAAQQFVEKVVEGISEKVQSSVGDKSILTVIRQLKQEYDARSASAQDSWLEERIDLLNELLQAAGETKAVEEEEEDDD